jgi:hypothetical protein
VGQRVKGDQGTQKQLKVRGHLKGGVVDTHSLQVTHWSLRKAEHEDSRHPGPESP